MSPGSKHNERKQLSPSFKNAHRMEICSGVVDGVCFTGNLYVSLPCRQHTNASSCVIFLLTSLGGIQLTVYHEKQSHLACILATLQAWSRSLSDHTVCLLRCEIQGVRGKPRLHNLSRLCPRCALIGCSPCGGNLSTCVWDCSSSAKSKVAFPIE